MTRTIQAPGIELREIDRSEYGKEDYSLTSTTVFACGFASKGPNYVINWINTIQNFIDTYGSPETEEEKYFYNTAVEVLQRGGIFLGARLPYNNEALTSYASIDYSLNMSLGDISDADVFPREISSQIRQLDPSLNKFLKIQFDSSRYITPDQLELLRVSSAHLPQNKIKIVDITHSQYGTVMINKTDPATGTTRREEECLGLVPVVTTALNALFYQGLISAETRFHDYQLDSASLENSDSVAGFEVTDHLSCFQPLSGYCRIYENTSINYDVDNYTTNLTSYSIYDNSVAKQAMNFFPTITFSNKYLDRTYLKQIGIVVFKMFKDSSTNQNISFQPLEAFVGSLNPKDRDTVTKRSIFIDDVVNSKSEFINVFSNINQNLDFNSFDAFFAVNNSTATLGLYKRMTIKQINYNTSIQQALNIILESAKDKNLYNIDIVCDAGISNIAQLSWMLNNSQITKKDFWKLENQNQTTQWKAILQKFTTFCSSMRKDCIFLADGLYPFALENNAKIVRRSLPQNTVEKNIIPKLKYMTGVNSSYAAGYSVWFQVVDAFSGDLLWLPPSIKAAGIFIYTDIYYNKWDAPAGMSRGKMANVIDCAFSPAQPDSEKLYTQCWNYAVSYPLDGIVMEGQRTFQMKKTAFDRINVRRLFLYLEKEVARVAKYFQYEGNTEFLRNKFVDTIRPIFEHAVTRGGIREYYIKCDDENNTTQTIENNELHCAIAVKPVKTIEFIILNFVCTNQSAVVSEVISE